MPEKYLLPTARCQETGEVIKQQDLAGGRYKLNERNFAQQAADRLASNLTARTRRDWKARVVEYSI